MPIISIRVLGYALVLWIIGLVWGTIVFAVPILKNIPSVAYVSNLPAVSVVLIPVYAVILYYLGIDHLRGKEETMRNGVKFGLSLAVVNILLDVLVYVILFGSSEYFAYLSIWVAYALFLIIPALAGRRPHEI